MTEQQFGKDISFANNELKVGWKDFNKGLFSIDRNIISIKAIKDLFMRDLDRARQSEEEFCKKNNTTRVFTNEYYNRVTDLLDQCKTFYEVEALAQYLFADNTIPELEEVKSKGYGIYLQFPTKYGKF